MSVRRLVIGGAAGVAALVAAGAALGVGPWPGPAQTVTAPAGDVRYVAARGGGATTVHALRVPGGSELSSATFRGEWSIPGVTINGVGGGVSPDGSLLVLTQPPTFNGLRTRSSFLVVSTKTLSQQATVTLKGEFGFDAISPDNGTLYLIEHASKRDLVSYRVRAYDLRANRLVAHVVADPRNEGEPMRGWPLARATADDGSWVYTLYMRSSAKPFVHALNASGRTAFCVDLPWRGRTNDVWNSKLQLSKDGQALVVSDPTGATQATIDTKTLKVRSG